MSKIVLKVHEKGQTTVKSEKQPRSEVSECYLCYCGYIFAKAVPIFEDGQISVIDVVPLKNEYPLEVFGFSELRLPWRYAGELPEQSGERKEQKRVKLIVTMNCSRCKRGKWCCMRGKTGCEHYEPKKVYCR